MVAPPRSSQAFEAAARKEAADRAERVTAMLDRWEAEDVSGEPEWNVEDLEPVTFRHSTADHEKSST